MLKTFFIEGLPGSGKSTTATKLGCHLQSEGHHITVVLEPDEVNPFRFEAGTSQDVRPSFFMQQIAKQWADFASVNSLKDGYLIQEAMTIQQQINFLLWMNRRDDIKPLVQSIFDISKELNPHLIYLYQKDAISAFKETMLYRGQSWVEEKINPIVDSPYAVGKSNEPIELIYAFINEAQVLTDSLFDLFPYKKLKVDISQSRENQFKEISRFISK